MKTFFYYLFQFTIGGVTIVAMTLLAKYVNPKYTGIVYALPLILIVAVVFVYFDLGPDIARKTVLSTLFYEFTTIFFVTCFYFFLGKFNFWWAMTLAVAA